MTSNPYPLSVYLAYVKLAAHADPALAQRIDNWRIANNIDSRANAIRQLVVAALNSQGVAVGARPPGGRPNFMDGAPAARQR